MRNWSLLKMAACLTLALVCLGGCVRQTYVVQMTPTEQGIKREMKIVTDGKSADVLAIAATQPAVSQQTATSHFTDDVGGAAGWWIRCDSSMGRASLYIERFRGSTDVAAEVEDRLAAANALTDHLIAWFRTELTAQAGWPRLRHWMDRDLRRHLKNLAIYAWSKRVTIGDDLPGQAAMLGAYMLQNELLAPEDLPAIGRILQGENINYQALMLLLQRKACDLMEVPSDKPVPRALAFLANTDRATTSLRRYLRTTDDYRQLVAEAAKQAAIAATQPSANEADPAEQTADSTEPKPTSRPSAPEPLEIPISLGTRAFMVHLDIPFFCPKDDVLVRLPLPAAPLSTNGHWDGKEQTVTWNATLPSSQVPVPPYVAYALNAQPDRAFQTRHFGKVVLEGTELIYYNVWHKGLSPDQARQWDAFVAGLKPGAAVKEALQNFRFAEEKTAALPPEQLKAARAVKGILSSLESAN